jgi:hypothetical protein
MGHVVLLGDSIFDNARYVPGGPAVIDHMHRALPTGWRATLLAIDGSVTDDVTPQLTRVPGDATHLVISSGGNDALGYCGLVLNGSASSFAEVLTELGGIRAEFQGAYRRMLQAARALGKATAVCTVYDAIPGLTTAELTGLAVFNEVILREAARSGVPVVDLRVVCSERSDYAESSPIEPSAAGGGKVARAVARVVIDHDFDAGGCRIYAG